MLDLLKLIPELGSAIAVIIVVVLFLRQQEAANLAWKAVTDEFTGALASQRQAVVDTIHQHLAALSGIVTAMGQLETTARQTNQLVAELHRMVQDQHKARPEAPQ